MTWFSLPHDLLRLTCRFLLPNLSNLPVSMFCCWWIPLLFCAPLASFHNSGLFLQCTYCCSCGTESCRHTHLSGQPYVYPWDGLDNQGSQLYEQRRGSLQPTNDLWPLFWSRAHRQRHVTICLMKFADGEWNVTTRYSFCVWLSNMNTVIKVDSICREWRERERDLDSWDAVS